MALPDLEFTWFAGPAPTWSPDGQQIAVIDSYGRRVEIHNAMTGRASGAASDLADAPAWTTRVVPGVAQQGGQEIQTGSATSPDGTMEARAVADFNSHIALQVRTGDRKLLTGAGQAPFAWSPDSRFVAASGFFEVVLVDAATGTSRPLAEAVGTSRSFNFGGVAWSPDGTRLAFTAREDLGSN